eukprot:366104-Chlamydomonas_euryale.AAC.10
MPQTAFWVVLASDGHGSVSLLPRTSSRGLLGPTAQRAREARNDGAFEHRGNSSRGNGFPLGCLS